MKTAFRFRLLLRRLRSAYDLVKIRLPESEAEAEEPNESQSVGTCILIGLSFLEKKPRTTYLTLSSVKSIFSKCSLRTTSE